MGIDTKLYAVVPSEPTEQQINRWAYELAVCFRHVVVHGKSEYGDRRALFIPEYHDIDNPNDEVRTVLEVNTMARYYVPGYERGPITDIIMVSEWLEIRLGAKVYYGPDSGYPMPFNAQERTAILQHFVKVVGETPYRGMPHKGVTAPICPFCIEPMKCNSMGPYDRFTFECMACDTPTITIDNNPPNVQASYASWVK